MKPSSFLSSSFLDILFEGKNKFYGAYELRLHYEHRLRLALLYLGAVIILLALFFRWSVTHKNMAIPPPPANKNINLTPVDLKEEIHVPMPKLPDIAKLKPQIKYTQFKVVQDNLVQPEEQPPDLAQLEHHVISTQTLKGDVHGLDVTLLESGRNNITGGSDPKKDKVFIYVEQMPRFPGAATDDDSNLKVMSFLVSHIHYPAMAEEQGIQGTIVVQFVIGPDGSIGDIQTVGKDPGGGLKEEALRVIRSMPKWIPGKQNGQAVSVRFTLPVKFNLR